ncbi:MAG: sigma-54-dependent Fis family transcriptional regulator, partial [Acidobacteria bacterium]
MSAVDHRLETLVVEDDPHFRETLLDFLGQLGHRAHGAGSIGEARARLAAGAPELLVSDIRLPDGDGVELLREVRRAHPATVVLVMTGFATVNSAVEAMRDGAADYLPKPFSMAQLRLAIDRALETRRLRRENAELRERLARSNGARPLIGSSPAMRRVLEMIDRLRGIDSTVLITGESGVGKELVVEALHAGHPRRAQGPLVPLHCGAIPRELIESELFGHVRGAFTGAAQDKAGRFEAATGGTLFLDEIGTMPLDLQVKLLRVLQTREVQRVGSSRTIPVDVRVIAATNEDLKAKVERGEFREDLYYRLNVIPLHVPPLRERRSDVPLLAAHFVRRGAERLGVPARELSRAALDRLMAHDWPGNVRELENVIEYALVMSAGAERIEA